MDGGRRPARTDDLVEEEVVGQAHRTVILNVKRAIPFFILTWLLTHVFSVVFGYALGYLIPPLWWLSSALYNILLGNIFAYGECIAGLRLYRNQSISTGTLFEGMQDYGRVMGGMFWYSLRSSLWMIVPVVGVMKRYSFLLTPYILYDQPELSPEEALQESAALTEGHKMEMFIRDVKFTGWRIGNAVTFGLLGILYYYGYHDAVWAGFYDALKSPRSPEPEREPVRREDTVIKPVMTKLHTPDRL